MKKRMLAALICLIMALALLPATAFALGESVIIGGVELENGSYYVNGANGAPGTVSFTEPSTGWNAYFHIDGSVPTLELNGLVLTGYAGDYGVYLPCDGPNVTAAKLVLRGSSTLSIAGTGIDSAKDSAGFYAVGSGNDENLTVSGTGSLTATNSNGHGISVIGLSLTASGGTLTGNGAGAAGNGVFEGNSSNNGRDKVTVSGGTVCGTSALGSGVLIMGGLVVSSGKLEGTGRAAGVEVSGLRGAAISGGEVTVAMNAIAASTNNAGMRVVANMVVSGGKVTVNGGYARHGITANTCIVSGGVVRTSGSAHAGIWAEEDIVMEGGVVQASAEVCALYVGNAFLINYPPSYEITASTKESGADPEPFDQLNKPLDRYEYFRIEPTNLRIAGIPLNLASCYYVNGANGAPGTAYETEPAGGAWNAHYEEADGAPVLTLRNLWAQGVDGHTGVYSKGSLHIVLEGASRVSGCAGSMANYVAVFVDGSLEMTGAGGSLTADTADSYEAPALHVAGNLTLGAGVALTGTSGRDVGISATGTLNLAGAGASVAGHSRRSDDARDSMCGIRAGSIVFSAPATLTASGVVVPAVKDMTVTTSGFPNPPGFMVTTSASPDGGNPTVTYDAYAYSAANKYLRIEPRYAITYDKNGGGGTMANGAATPNAVFTLPECTFTAPTGQQFKEWAIGTPTGTRVAAGAGYTFTGDTTVYAVWMAAPAVKLAAPTNPAWDTTVPAKAMWTASPNAPGYTVQLYRNGAPSGAAVDVSSGTAYDFTSRITQTGAYTFRVTAKGDGARYRDSDPSAESAPYRYTAPVTPTVRALPTATFPRGGAPEIAVTVGEGIDDFDLSNFAGSVQMGLRGVDPLPTLPGACYRSENGSIRIVLFASYLNTLEPGVYTLQINLQGTGYAPYVRTTITVTAPGNVPKTGDSAPLLPLAGIALLSGAGLAASAALRRKKRAR